MADFHRYSSKEIQDEIGLNLYDFGWRGYDPAISRWTSIDLLADSSISMTPYHYVANNPLLNIDPDGRDWFVNQENGATIFIKGVSKFEYHYLVKILGNELTSKIAEGSGPGAWKNFGADNAFDTKDKKYSEMTMVVLDPENAETFMNGYGYRKALDQKVDDMHLWETEIDDGKHSTDYTHEKTILSSKVTYVKPDQFRKEGIVTQSNRGFGTLMIRDTYRQVIPYYMKEIEGVPIIPRPSLGIQDLMNMITNFELKKKRK